MQEYWVVPAPPEPPYLIVLDAKEVKELLREGCEIYDASPFAAD